jgi:hypothetical protein
VVVLAKVFKGFRFDVHLSWAKQSLLSKVKTYSDIVMRMQRKLIPFIMVNVFLIFVFLVSNYAIWNMVNSNTHLGHTVMNPLHVIESNVG